MISRFVCDYLDDTRLQQWRTFVKQLNQSNPFRELWAATCVGLYGKPVTLIRDVKTRFSSTVTMISQASTVKDAVEKMWTQTYRIKEYQKYTVCCRTINEPINSFYLGICP